ncbi:hypothetical protein CRENBAI_013583 [Crenichthys baileyi]|uniref:Uncharacterized protein n=1 Tax=Crenichthys baileyi TaxID=28760 RepID=A0AAV9S565_9TELE
MSLVSHVSSSFNLLLCIQRSASGPAHYKQQKSTCHQMTEFSLAWLSEKGNAPPGCTRLILALISHSHGLL